MRFEAYAQASGNRHEPNCSDNNTEMFSLNDIDEIIEKIAIGTLDNWAIELMSIDKIKVNTITIILKKNKI